MGEDNLAENQEFNGCIEVTIQENIMWSIGCAIHCLKQCGVGKHVRKKITSQMAGYITRHGASRWRNIGKELKHAIEGRCQIECRTVLLKKDGDDNENL